MTPERLRVALAGRGYDILVGTGLLDRAGEHMGPILAGGPRPIILCDAHVAALHLETLQASLTAAGLHSEPVILPPGEGLKTLTELDRVLEKLFAIGLERRSTLIAFGGGVIGDLTGFAAAVALRGIGFIQIPTTLLAQVDSSVGGKTGVNARAGKNLVGAFHQPRLVLADLDLLDSLPRRELLAGYAEIVKYGALGAPEFFTWLEANGAALIAGDTAARRHGVLTSCRIKADIVAADEHESGGSRALLNLGHTFGHALESAAGYGERLLHGEAVAIGMCMAFDLSARLGLVRTPDAPARLRRHLDAVGLPTRASQVPELRLDAGDLIARMGRDKKVANGCLQFVLVRDIGDAFLSRDVKDADLRAFMKEAIRS